MLQSRIGVRVCSCSLTMEPCRGGQKILVGDRPGKGPWPVTASTTSAIAGTNRKGEAQPRVPRTRVTEGVLRVAAQEVEDHEDYIVCARRRDHPERAGTKRCGGRGGRCEFRTRGATARGGGYD